MGLRGPQGVRDSISGVREASRQTFHPPFFSRFCQHLLAKQKGGSAGLNVHLASPRGTYFDICILSNTPAMKDKEKKPTKGSI